MNPNRTVPHVDVAWSGAEVHGFHASALRDLAAERIAAGDQAEAARLEHLAAGADLARRAAQAGQPRITSAEWSALRFGARALDEVAEALARDGLSDLAQESASQAAALNDLRRRAVLDVAGADRLAESATRDELELEAGR
jgi:hypothetical protein